MVSHRILQAILVMLLAVSVAGAQTTDKPAAKAKRSGGGSMLKQAGGKPTVAEAEAFMKKAEDQLEDLNVRANRAGWVQENFITDDTETISAQANEKLTAVVTQLALDARRFDKLKKPPE